MSVVLGKVAISFFLSILTIILLAKKEKFNHFFNSNPQLTIIGAWLALRVLPFSVVYLILNFAVKSDVIFFYDTARLALDGLIVYRDFWQPYSPLFPYLNAITLAIVDSPVSIIFLMMIYELIAIYITKTLSSYKYAVFFIVIYLTLPAPFIFLIFGGQEDIFLWLFIALAMWCFRKTHNALHIGLILGLGILCTKILLIIPIALLLVFSKQRVKILSGLLIIGIPSIAIMLYLTGEKILAPLQLGDLPFAPNLVSIISPFVGGIEPNSKLLNWGGLLVILGVTSYYLRNIRSYSETWLLLFAFIFTNIITIIVHKNSLPNYLYTILLPVIYIFGDFFRARQWVVMILLNIIGAVQPSLWYYLGGKYYASFSGFSILNAVEYLLQIVYLALCIYMVYFLSRLSRNDVRKPSLDE
jgi:hypothetical protein